MVSLIDKCNPNQVVVIWEGGGSKRKRDLYSEYKKNRKLAEDFAKKSQSAFNKFYKEKDTTLLDRLNDEYDRQVKAIKSSIMADEDKYG